MFIRVTSKTAGNTTNDMNVNVKSIVSFAPVGGDESGSVLNLSNGVQLRLEESTRSIRSRIKSALAPAAGDNEFDKG